MAAGKYDLPQSAREATTPGGGLIIRTLSSSTSASSQAKHTVSDDVSADPWRSDSDDLEPTSPTATAAAAAAHSPSKSSPFSTHASRNSSVSRSAQRRAMWMPGSGEGSDDSDAGSSGEEGMTDGGSAAKRGGSSQLYRPAAMNPYGKVLQPAASQPQPLAAAASTPQVPASAASMPGAPPSPAGAHHQRAVSVPSEQELEAWRKRQDAAVAAAAARRKAAEAATAAAEAGNAVPAQGQEGQAALVAPAPSPALGKTVSSVSSGSLALHAVGDVPEAAPVAVPAPAAAVPATSLKQGVTHDRPAITRWLSTDDIPPPPGVSLGHLSTGVGPGGPPAPSTKSLESTPRRAHSTDGGGVVPLAAKAASKAALVHVRSAFAQSKAALQRFSAMAKVHVGHEEGLVLEDASARLMTIRKNVFQAHMKYLECLRTVFGGGSAAPPDDAAAALARGAKRLRTVIETETRAGQALAASWAGSAAWLAARPAEQERTGAGLLAVLREVAVEVMACDSYLTEAVEALRDVIRPPKSVKRSSGKSQGSASEAPPAVRVIAAAAGAEALHEGAAAEQPDARSDTSAIDDAHRLIGRHADAPAPGQVADAPVSTEMQDELAASNPDAQPMPRHIKTSSPVLMDKAHDADTAATDQGEDQLGTLRSHSPDASPPTPERRWPGKPRRETATSDVCFDSGTTQLQPAFVRESQSPESPDGSSGGEVTGATQEVPPSSSAAAPADEIQPAGQRGTSEASQQLQALAHHLMDEVSQLRMELSKRVAEKSALEARVALQSDYIQQLEACVGQSTSSRDSSGDMEGSQAALDSPGAQYRRLKQQEQEQRGLDRQQRGCATADGSADGSSARSSGDGSAQAGGYENDGGGSVHVTAAPRQVPGNRAAAARQSQRMPGGGSPPGPELHAGSLRGRGVLAFAAGDGTRAMALAARFDSIVAGGRAHQHHGVSGLRPAGDSPDVTPSPSPLRTAGW